MSQPEPPPNKPKEKEEGARSFGVFLGQLHDGRALAELTQENHDLLVLLHHEALSRGQAGKAKGKLTLTIDFTVEASGVVGAKYNVGTKEPKPDRSDDVFWLTKGKNLSKENPKQVDMFPRQVPPEQLRDAADDEETSIARDAKG